MLAREKWQIRTIAVLDEVFAERVRQMGKHGAAMERLPGGTGPGATWVSVLDAGSVPADEVQKTFRVEYEMAEQLGELTRMHLVREEIAEAFELDENDPRFRAELLQVAALCVQWAEYLEDVL